MSQFIGTKHPRETWRNVPLSFENRLAAGDTIAVVNAVAATVDKIGSDPDPSAILSGAPTIEPVEKLIVFHDFTGGGVSGHTTYQIEVDVTTTLGENLVGEFFLTVKDN